MKIICQDCHNPLLLKSTGRLRKPIHVQHYILCKDCLSSKNICSLSNIKQTFMLDDNDLKKVKCIYIGNPKNKKKFFIFSDIEQIILEKYKSYENLEKLKREKLIDSKVQLERDTRREELMEALNNNKLEYKNYGDCYSFIKYGTPSIDTVIKNELDKLEIKRNRKINLANELAKLEIPLDEDLPSCYNYINGIGCKNLIETIREIEIEHYFKNNTNYMKYLEQVDPKKAKKLAKSEINTTNNIRVNFN